MAMFCPKCGKDCGSENFCSKCGTRLQQAAQESKQTVWKLGMPCPNCGGTQLKGKFCAFCDVQLIEDEPEVHTKKKAWGNIPLGVYQGVYGYLKLKEDVMIIQNRRNREYTIPYNQVTAVKYVKPKGLYVGQLIIRWKENAHIPFPETFGRTVNDETTLLFRDEDNSVFFQIYHVIKDLIEE